MFLIMGVYEHSKEIEYDGKMGVCSFCGRYCSYKIFVSYMCLSLFFIPIIKWGKRYFLVPSCCGKSYELSKESGKKAERGIITDEDIQKEIYRNETVDM